MTTQLQSAKNLAAASEMALRVAQLERMRTAVTTCWPHLRQLGTGEQRLIRICEWSLKADQPVTAEQSEWLEDIVNRVTRQPIAA